MAADGSNQKRVTKLPGEEDHPSFSPYGDEIVFTETVNDVATLMLVRTNGTYLRAVTHGNVNDWNPSWSKYGIVFSSNRGSDHFNIWKVLPDGSGLAQVGNTVGLDPVWLPDGRILFSDEVGSSAALSTIILWDPRSGSKQTVSNVEGYFVGIDIRPGTHVNRINPRSEEGTVPVAILSQLGLEPFTGVDQATLTFGRTGSEKSLVRCKKHGVDLNKDGVPDLICRFSIRVAGFRAGDNKGILRFRDGEYDFPYEGRDAIVTVTEDEKDDHNHRDDD